MIKHVIFMNITLLKNLINSLGFDRAGGSTLLTIIKNTIKCD